ncbi:PspC domain-containing protein [Candidatus Dojkabacteria bacterium]|nr:PspC domain-containing protein [Candidatus Dojkabacteria bacterium]
MKNKTEKTSKQGQSTSPGALCRSEVNKIIGGVSGGLGEYFGIDPSIVRIVFILVTLFGGSGILIYIILWIIIPSEENVQETGQKTLQNNIKEVEQKAKEIIKGSRSNDSRLIWGMIIIVVGFIFLFDSLFNIKILRFDKIWPLIIIAFGILILFRNVKK